MVVCCWQCKESLLSPFYFLSSFPDSVNAAEEQEFECWLRVCILSSLVWFLLFQLWQDFSKWSFRLSNASTCPEGNNEIQNAAIQTIPDSKPIPWVAQLRGHHLRVSSVQNKPLELIISLGWFNLTALLLLLLLGTVWGESWISHCRKCLVSVLCSTTCSRLSDKLQELCNPKRKLMLKAGHSQRLCHESCELLVPCWFYP